MLNTAFQLAHSIYRYRGSDRTVALAILWEALRGIQVRLVAQHEADRHEPLNPTKVRWNTRQWFQILIYYKSEFYEKQQEANSPLAEEDMLIRYIKHLLLTTSRRNSFHISLGLSRLLYDYGASETMSIYDLVFQDPDSSAKKADAYYRARKTRLIEELAKRFHGFLRISHGARGEKRFETNSNSIQCSEMVKQYLTYFTPWETQCELPSELDLWTVLDSLQSSQANQIHSLIHPACFAKIVQALRLDIPEKRLLLPKFFLPNGNAQNIPPGDGTASSLTDKETANLQQKLSEEALRRKRFIPSSLSVLADGSVLTRFDLASSTKVSLEIDDDVTLIEVVGHRGATEVLLATHIVVPDDDADRIQSREFCAVLEGGKKIFLLLTPRWELDRLLYQIEITYQEGSAQSVVAGWSRWFEQLTLPRLRINSPVFTFMSILVGLIAAAFIIVVFLNRSPNVPTDLAKQGAFDLTTEGAGAPTPGAAPSLPSSPTLPRIPSTKTAKGLPATKTSRPGGLTRERSLRASRSLLSIERVYVQSPGDDSFSLSIRENLIKALRRDTLFVITDVPDTADTAIAVSVGRADGNRNVDSAQETGTVRAELLNVSGELIWETKVYKGTAERIAAQFTNDLLEAIRKEKQRQKG